MVGHGEQRYLSLCTSFCFSCLSDGEERVIEDQITCRAHRTGSISQLCHT